MIAIPATPPTTIPAMVPPLNPLVLVLVGEEMVVPVLAGAEVPVPPVAGVIATSLVGVESLPVVSAAAVTVRIVDFVAHSSQVSPPPAMTSVAQKAAVEPLMVGIVNIVISNDEWKRGAPFETWHSGSASGLCEVITFS